ncbi:MAG: single-stranded-DNA-specific exonuclease RecJ [Rickettsia endosymbiont of Labidopullus appendiculatus]|nr:single-stranded-DNA-specific exonuclease RecJ [Rickettsia endosymbiont of Labidopullus appendiculatus]
MSIALEPKNSEPKFSVNGKIWQQRLVNEYDVLELCRSVGISDFLARVLSPRLENLVQATDFLSPKLKNLLPDTFHLLDMQKAVDRTIEAIINKQKICIFADYDVDGATSSSLLKNLFRNLGQEVDIYVPDRIAEGYGPTPAAMQKIKDNATKLLITVDCGAMAHEALKYASLVGLDVIVIDHHISSDILPEAVAVVNPNRIDETSDYKYLAAVGVSFLFATALLSDLKKQNFFANDVYATQASLRANVRERGNPHSLEMDCFVDAKASPRNRPLSKLAYAEEFVGDTSPRTAAYSNVREDSSTGSTHKLPAEVEFRKRSNDVVGKSSYNIPNLMQYLDLVALGTVCDVMKLIHLNRAFVAQGLKILQQRKNLGMTTLCDIAGLNEKPNCYHLGFVLGPRINAGGRVGKSSLGASLLSTECSIEANRLAQELEKHNNERKVIELIMIEEATKIALTQENDSSLFIVGKGWHPGVIGIVAGRLKEKFNKPVSVIALNNGVGKASCRSIKNVDFGSKIINAKTKELIVVGGGHAMAAGFTVLEEKLQELQEFLNHAFKSDMSNQNDLICEEYDVELTTNSVNLLLMDELSKLEPFGQGNPEPIFKFSNLFVLKADIVGEKHIRCLLAPSKEAFGSKALPAIAFNAVSTPIENVLLNVKSHNISVIGSLKMNSWQERHTIQLQIKDLII